MDHLDKPYDILLNVLQLDEYPYKMNLISIIKKAIKIKCLFNEFLYILDEFLFLIQFHNKFDVLIHLKNYFQTRND